MTKEGYYSIDELSGKLGKNKKTVYVWLKEKRIKSKRMGTYAYVKKDEVDEWLNSYEPLDVDCAYAGLKGCSGLQVSCIPSLCTFRKTKQEAEASLEKAHKRLRSLTPVLQKYIADKYYGGKKVWEKG